VHNLQLSFNFLLRFLSEIVYVLVVSGTLKIYQAISVVNEISVKLCLEQEQLSLKASYRQRQVSENSDKISAVIVISVQGTLSSIHSFVYSFIHSFI